MKKLKFQGLEEALAVEKGVMKLNTKQTDALLATHCEDYKPGMLGTVRKAVQAAQETIYPEVTKAMLEDGLTTDLAIQLGAGGMAPTIVFTRENSGTRTDAKTKEKIPWKKHALVSTKFKSLKPSGKFADGPMAEMAKSFEKKMK